MKKETRRKLEKLLERLGKRPRSVLGKLLEFGQVSTFDLGELGYDQPPRAAQDLKENGVKLEVSYGRHPETGNRMAIYRLSDNQPLIDGKFNGRLAFPKKFREQVMMHYASTCVFCAVPYENSSLQIDHRIPYQIAGEVDVHDVAAFMPLCSSHQRTKSWACEHCSNYQSKDESVCKTCYWAIPDKKYLHVATISERQLCIIWRGETEVRAFETLKELAEASGKPVAQFVKEHTTDLK